MVERDIVKIARRELGESGEKETWWWGQQVGLQEAVKAKKEAFKNWRTTVVMKWINKYIRSPGKQQRLLLKLNIWHMKICMRH